MNKEWYKSKTVWGAIALALGAIASAAGAVLMGDTTLAQAVEQAWPLVVGAFTAFGLRDAIK